MQDRPLILWFRRDLRLADQPMLAAAVATERPLVPVFVLDPETEALGAAAKDSRVTDGSVALSAERSRAMRVRATDSMKAPISSSVASREGATERSAAANSFAVAKRSAGSMASARITTAHRASGRSPRTDASGSAASRARRRASLNPVRAGKRRCSVSASQSTTPAEKMSARRS